MQSNAKISSVFKENVPKDIRDLVNHWQIFVDRYCEEHDGDNPWWYNERASISVLSAAAWQLKDGVALEEFGTSKKAHVKAADLKNGRCDLYVGVGDEMYVFEAKQVWIDVVKEDFGKFRDGIDRAVQDVERLDEEDAVQKAISFAVPYFDQTSKNEAKDTLSK